MSRIVTTDPVKGASLYRDFYKFSSIEETVDREGTMHYIAVLRPWWQRVLPWWLFY